MDQAEAMLRKHLVWRKENEIDTIRNHQLPPHFRTALPYDIIGLDYDNCPVLVLPLGRWDLKTLANSGEAKEFLRFKDQIHETLVELMRGKLTPEGVPVTQFSVVVDLEQISFRQTSLTVLEMMRDDLSRFESNFPERLKTNFIINAPWFLSIAMNFIRPFTSARTLEKFKVYGSDRTKWIPALQALLSEDQLPVLYGGQNKNSRLNTMDVKEGP
jgi:hypothetical protein